MQQTVIKIGNSLGITLPAQYARAAGITKGSKVDVTHDPLQNITIIKSTPSKTQAITKKTDTKSDAEYQKWLSQFMEENGEILDELAVR